MKSGEYQFMFKKGSEWRGYHSNFGIVLPDGVLLSHLRRTVFTNIALIDARSYTKPVDQEYYEVSGSIMSTSMPSAKDIEDLLMVSEISAIKDGDYGMYVYDPYCIMYSGENKFIFFTHLSDMPIGLKCMYDENDGNKPLQEFIPVLLNSAEDYDVSGLNLPVGFRYNSDIDKANTQLSE